MHMLYDRMRPMIRQNTRVTTHDDSALCGAPRYRVTGTLPEAIRAYRSGPAALSVFATFFPGTFPIETWIVKAQNDPRGARAAIYKLPLEVPSGCNLNGHDRLSLTRKLA
jgi:hypothetical protein